MEADDADIQVVARYVASHNAHDLDGIFRCCDPSGLAIFESAEMPMPVFREELGKIMRSFPDVTFTAESGIECTTSDRNMGMVKIQRFVVRGTHTAAPFGFGPYVPVQASGVSIELDPEFVIFTVVSGLITEINVTPMGPSTGPPGIYQQIGGNPQANHVFF